MLSQLPPHTHHVVVAQCHSEVGETYRALGRFGPALAFWHEAVKLRLTAVVIGLVPELDISVTPPLLPLLAAWRQCCPVSPRARCELQALARPAEATASCCEALRIREAMLSGNDPDVLETRPPLSRLQDEEAGDAGA